MSIEAVESWLDFNTTEINTAEPEDALDRLIEWFECELLTVESVTLYATTADVDPSHYGWPSDPLWVHGNDKVWKRLPIAELAETRKRWHMLGRSINRVTTY